VDGSVVESYVWLFFERVISRDQQLNGEWLFAISLAISVQCSE
jgi:hypothetical protein